MEKKKDEIQASVTVKLADNGKTYHANASDCFSVFYRNGMPYIEAVNDYSIKLEEAKKEKNELLNFAFNEQDEKIKFYRETLVEMTKEAYRKKPKELKTEEAVEEGELLTKAIIKKVDEFEVAMKQHFNLDKERVNYYFGGDNCVAKDFTCTDPNFFKGVNPDYLKTEQFDLSSNSVKQMADSVKDSMRTIVDNGPQYQANQKPYGTLGEHFEELIYLFDFKKNHSFYKNALQSFIEKYKTKDFNPFKGEETYFSLITEHETKCLIDIANSLGIEFIEDFVKACEKCEE